MNSDQRYADESWLTINVKLTFEDILSNNARVNSVRGACENLQSLPW